MDCDDIDNDLLQPLSINRDTEAGTQNDFISIVDMSTLICKNFNDTTSFSQDPINEFDNQTEFKYQPLMPLTIELMRRKSLYYMGLDQSLFFRLLQIIKSTTGDMNDALMEMKIMLTLRKHRLNEEFEALGDLFDIDRTSAQQYYAESKNLVSNLFHSLTGSASSPTIPESNDVKSSLRTEHYEVTKYEQEDDEVSINLKIPYKGFTYKGFASSDSDVNSSELQSSDSESDYSEGVSDESYSGSDEPKKNLVKETVQCPLCGKYVGLLDYHMKTHHLNPQYLNKTLCGLCFQKFDTNTKLRAHQQDLHNGNSCGCEVCGKMFPKFSAVKVHILKVHSKVKPFLCHQCGSSHFSLSKLRIHTQNVHLQIRNHECKLCDKKYIQAAELCAHIRSKHTKERPFKCRFDGCGKSFCRSGNRHTHEQMHKVRFSCEICAKVFSFRQNLQTHCKNIHGMNVINTDKCKIQIIQ